jgi:methylated-DNA-[protein]-cysteine S-methyltransferase
MSAQYDALINTPFGAIAISSHAGQIAIELLIESPSASNIESAKEDVALVYRQLKDYLNQTIRTFDTQVFPHGTDYQRRVWQAISQIPFGETRTYSQLARQIGSGPRAVANACGANMLPLIVPCHRVVAQNGLGGFMQSKPDGLRVKKWLLQHEGVDLSLYE